jgi:hypothetical protein
VAALTALQLLPPSQSIDKNLLKRARFTFNVAGIEADADDATLIELIELAAA